MDSEQLKTLIEKLDNLAVQYRKDTILRWIQGWFFFAAAWGIFFLWVFVFRSA